MVYFLDRPLTTFYAETKPDRKFVTDGAGGYVGRVTLNTNRVAGMGHLAYPHNVAVTRRAQTVIQGEVLTKNGCPRSRLEGLTLRQVLQSRELLQHLLGFSIEELHTHGEKFFSIRFPFNAPDEELVATAEKASRAIQKVEKKLRGVEEQCDIRQKLAARHNAKDGALEEAFAGLLEVGKNLSTE